MFMELILSKFCRSFTGYVSRSHGYYVRRVQNRFLSQRSGKTSVPLDGHLRFILAMATLAQDGLLLSDIRIEGRELMEAFDEAGYPSEAIAPERLYNATEVLLLNRQKGILP